MAALGDLIIICVVGFVIVAILSLVLSKTPATPPFARRVPTSGNPQLRQDANAGFLHDRGFLFRKRVWFVGTCCPPVRIGAPGASGTPGNDHHPGPHASNPPRRAAIPARNHQQATAGQPRQRAVAEPERPGP